MLRHEHDTGTALYTVYPFSLLLLTISVRLCGGSQLNITADYTVGLSGDHRQESCQLLGCVRTCGNRVDFQAFDVMCVDLQSLRSYLQTQSEDR